VASNTGVAGQLATAATPLGSFIMQAAQPSCILTQLLLLPQDHFGANPAAAAAAGHMEYTPVFLASAKYIPMKEDWPTVIGGAMKLWFKSQEEVHEPEYKGHSKYRE
jgi:hypothetical protein